MNVVKASRQFEEWLGKRTTLVKKDLQIKHKSMKDGEFAFFRATYYRWAQIWPKVCPELAKSPRVLAISDLHIENFGTWRDAEGRLIWGVNDFDEAYSLGYANDLVRLAVSAHLASAAGNLTTNPKEICGAILEGYAESMQTEGRPYVLGEEHTWLRKIAEGILRDPVRFWAKLSALPTLKGDAPVSAVEALEHLMPAPDIKYRLAPRVAGLGSLGHTRLVAIAQWHGGMMAREVKALTPSAVAWAENEKRPVEILYQAILSRAVRCPDPFVQLRGRWIVRRLSPSCSRVELPALSVPGSDLRLLHAMGWETANVHLGSQQKRKQVLQHLKKQPAKWLHRAAEEMLQAVLADWRTWKKNGYA